MARAKPALRFGFLVTGTIFLLNPNINLLDLLPDAIGILFLLAGISGAAGVLPYFDEARERLTKCLWLSLSKFPALFLMLIVIAGNSSQRSMITVFAFAYAILDLMFFLPAFRALYEGFFYLGERFDCPATVRDTKRVHPARLPFWTTLFFAARSVGSTLPEFALLPVNGMTDSDKVGWVWIVNYYPFFILASVLIVSVFGVLFAVRQIRYFRHIRADGCAEKVVQDKLAAASERVFRAREVSKIRRTAVLLTIGIGLGLDLIFDGINILPDPLSGCFLFLTVLSIAGRRRDFPSWIAAALTLVYTASATVSYALSCSFFSQYTYRDVTDDIAAARLYATYIKASFFETVLSVLMTAALLVLLFRLIVRAVNPLNCEISGSRQSDEARKSLRREATVLTVFGILVSLGQFAYVFLMQQTKQILLDPDGLDIGGALGQTMASLPRLEWFWMIPLALSVIRLSISWHFATRMIEEAKISYSDL